MMTPEHIKCPICSGNTYFVARHNQYDISLLKCSSCKFYFSYPYKSYFPEDFLDKPQNDNSRIWWAPGAENSYFSWRNAENERIINLIKPYATNVKVLEIGFGEGPLTESLMKITDDYWGIEPEISYYDNTIKRLKLDKEKCFNCTIENILNTPDLKEHRGYFDFVVLASVFEHLAYPRDILKIINIMLKKGGKLFISTPDSTNFKYFYYLRKLFGMELWCCFHISFFNRKNIELAFSNANFRVSNRLHASLITRESAKYFGDLTNSRLIKHLMNCAGFSSFDKLINLTTLNYILEKEQDIL